MYKLQYEVNIIMNNKVFWFYGSYLLKRCLLDSVGVLARVKELTYYKNSIEQFTINLTNLEMIWFYL